MGNNQFTSCCGSRDHDENKDDLKNSPLKSQSLPKRETFDTVEKSQEKKRGGIINLKSVKPSLPQSPPKKIVKYYDFSNDAIND